MFRRGLRYFLLVFFLLFAQQGGFAHEISHVARTTQGEKQLPHSTVCDQCAAYSQVGAGAISQPLPFTPPQWVATRYEYLHVAHVARHCFHYPSRAPPSLA